MFIGDNSGRVMVWMLTSMSFVAEIIASTQKIVYIQCHPVLKQLNVTDGSVLFLYDLESYQLSFASDKRHNLYALFTPTKDEKCAVVRSGALDVYLFDKLAISYPTTINNYMCCGQRMTSTIPQIVVLTCSNGGEVQVIAISTKVMPIFTGESNEQTLAQPRQ